MNALMKNRRASPAVSKMQPRNIRVYGGTNPPHPQWNHPKGCGIKPQKGYALKEIFSDFFIYYPDYMIIENDTSVYNGTAHIYKNKEKLYNSYGYLLKYKIEQISIKKSSLVKEGFSKAFSTYCHELCHCFGTDASSAFSKVLTDIVDIIIRNTENLQTYKRLWLDHF
jgi:hypothetical protein